MAVNAQYIMPGLTLVGEYGIISISDDRSELRCEL